jgi:hypothetical protein
MTKSPNPIFVLAFLMGGEMPIFDQSGSIQKKTSGSRAAFLGDQKLKNFLLLQRALKEMPFKTEDEELIVKHTQELEMLLQSSRPLLSDIVIIRSRNSLNRYQRAFVIIRFQIRRPQGLTILQTMEASLENERFAEIFEQVDRMTSLIKDLEAVNYESFGRLAEVLLKRALTFKVEVEKKKRLAELSLFVMGTILDQRRGGIVDRKITELLSATRYTGLGTM